ncbi:ATP-binding protein [Niallia sp. Krafla_26]|uniref:ATP-binding protein n=1 Tax=Niallia sp. Krafla_26 TaxID=3064703 RepID=UPI003D186A3F
MVVIKSENDIRIAINSIRLLAKSLDFSNVDMQKIIVAVSELTQNILDHSGTIGIVKFEAIGTRGIRIVVEDRGKGIDQLERILQGHKVYSQKGLGLGLLGAKRLMDEFTIDTSKEGTKIIAVKWKGKKFG